jgi:Protein of unknown function (DUF3631)
VLIDKVAAVVRRHVVMDAAEADSVALWVIAVYAFDVWVIFPRLFVNSPEKGCGKSTLLDVLSRLIPKPLNASNATAAGLFRVIEAKNPTLLLDEADTFARYNEELRGIINAGHRHDGYVIRTVGDDHEPRQFSVWTPMALAAIGRLPDTIEDRSIQISLRRRRPDETIEPLRLDRTAGLEELARMAARWAMDYASALKGADPQMPPGVSNRAADNWRPLLAVADLAGGIWPERARRAALAHSATSDDQSIGIALLADIRAAFAARRVNRLSSEELAAYLGNLEDRPWPDYGGSGRPISKIQIGRLLKPFRISPGSIRLSNGSTPKGYKLTAFREAFASYLPPENATPPQPKDSRGSARGFKPPRRSPRGVSKGPGLASISAACGAVAGCEREFVGDEAQEPGSTIEHNDGHPQAEAGSFR